MKRTDALHEIAARIQLLRILIRITGEKPTEFTTDLIYSLKRYYPRASILLNTVKANGVELKINDVVNQNYFEMMLVRNLDLIRGIKKITEIEYRAIQEELKRW